MPPSSCSARSTPGRSPPSGRCRCGWTATADGPSSCRYWCPLTPPAARGGCWPASPAPGRSPTRTRSGSRSTGDRAVGSASGRDLRSGAPRGGTVSLDQVAAWLDGEPVPAAEVIAEVTRLPRDGTADGRQLRRWMAQRVVLRRLLERERAERGLAPDGGWPVGADPALLGAAAADVLATSAAARAVFAAVTAGVTVEEGEI